jgi:adenine C2-methylase RlmN of 23S rRNA A2503 and tRNA A37
MTGKEIERIALEIRLATLQGVNIANEHWGKLVKLSYDFEIEKLKLINKNLEEQTKLSRIMQEREFAQIQFQEKIRGEE